MNPYGVNLTVVFPAYNESARIRNAIYSTVNYFKGWHIKVEIIVVVNGATDDTYYVASDSALFVARAPVHNVAIRIERTERGKGRALRYGMELSKGDKVLLSDVDLSAPLINYPAMVAHQIGRDLDIVIGSRNVPGAVVTGRTDTRKLTGSVFATLARAYAPGIRDTQCGFKLLTRKAINAVTPLLTLDGFAFDVELIHVARCLGYRVGEVPVIWSHDNRSTVRVVPDSMKMGFELLRIGYNHAVGRYRV